MRCEMMENCKDLGRVRIVIARSSGQSISKIAALVECSMVCYGQKYDQKWSKKGTVIN